MSFAVRTALLGTKIISNYCPLRTLSVSAVTMVKAKRFVLAEPYIGEVQESNYKLVEEELPPIKEGEILLEAEWLSVDPYMRAYASKLKLGETMIGLQVAKIIESKNPKFPVGKSVVGDFGWQSHLNASLTIDPHMYLLPETGKLPTSVGLGTLGMPGFTAYFGFLELCQPKAGEVVVVSTAAGAVGNVVGQIAKIKGCKVIGYTGSDEKVQWLKELGFDYAYNYKKVKLSKSLKEAAPEGVDCYFDNIGGAFSSTVLFHMKEFGRVSVCGAVATYNEDVTKLLVPPVQGSIVMHQLKVEGFLVTRWLRRFPEAIQQLHKWIQEDKLKHKETVYEGFNNMPKALISLMKGDNVGKAVVKA